MKASEPVVNCFCTQNTDDFVLWGVLLKLLCNKSVQVSGWLSAVLSLTCLLSVNWGASLNNRDGPPVSGAHVHSSDSPSVVSGPPAASPGTLLEIQVPGLWLHPRPTESDTRVEPRDLWLNTKPSRWFWWTLKFASATCGLSVEELGTSPACTCLRESFAHVKPIKQIGR